MRWWDQLWRFCWPPIPARDYGPSCERRGRVFWSTSAVRRRRGGLNSPTGWNLSADAYMEIGKRIQTVRQLFNIKHGVEPRDLIPRGRVKGDPPLRGGALKGITLPIEDMVALTWRHFGWNEETGVPEDELMTKLRLSELLK